MSKNTKTFDEAVETIATETTTAAVATTKPQAVATIESGSDFVGEIDPSDISTPRLSVVQKVGELSEEFPSGTILLNRRLVVAKPGEPVKITVAMAKKYYMEALPFGSETRPRVFMTAAEVDDADLTLKYNFETGEKATAKSCLDCLILVRSPEGVEAPEFNVTFDGEGYAVAQWNIASPSAYNAAGKSLLSARTMYLSHFAEQEWELTANKMKFGANMVYVPEVKPSAKNTEEYIAWASSLLS